MTDARRIAYEALLLAEEGERTNTLTKDVLDKYSYLDPRDRALIKRLIEGVTERRISIDHVLNQVSSVPVSKMKKQVRTLLRMGVYQLFYMDKIDDHAAVFETVRIAKKTKAAPYSGFINGVLRNVCRFGDEIVMPDPSDTVKYLSVKYSCPEWIVEKLLTEQGRENAECVLALSLSIRPVTARVNLSRTTVEEVATSSHIASSDICDIAVVIEDHEDISGISAVADGRICIQDIGSMLVCMAAGIKETDSVIDLCAAPGGKSLHAADIAVKGHVSAYDVSPKKVERIAENAKRCGFTNISCDIKDATVYDETLEASADVVIADVPCSGLGVMGRKNDIRFGITKDRIDLLVELQRRILYNAARYVKPGGTLVFSTCTVSYEENQKNADYLENVCHLTPTGFYDLIPEKLADESAKNGRLQLYGKDLATDGFFIARFTK